MPSSAGVVKRWGDAGLNASIATIYPYSGDPLKLLTGASQEQGGGAIASPNEQMLPRARYATLDSDPLGDTADEKLFEQKVLLFVVAKLKTTLKTHLSAIESAFENSQNLATNPFVITGYTVTEVEPAGSRIHVAEHACLLEMVYCVRFHRARKNI